MRNLKILHLLLISCLMQAVAHAKFSEKMLEDIRLQIFLDQNHFGPGVLDGKPGTYTKLAIEAYNQKNGHELSDTETVKSDAKKSVEHPFAVATVPDAVSKFVNPKLPYKRIEQAEEKQMSYRSVAEFMAERYHTTQDILISLNDSKTINNLKARSALKVPNVKPFIIEELANGKQYSKDKDLSRRFVVVDTKKKQLRIFDAPFPIVEKAPETTSKALIVGEDYKPYDETKAQLIAAFPITPGQTKYIHYGRWAVKNAVEFPTWRYDKQLLETGVRGKESLNIPAGPNNPVGVLWVGLTKSGIGIHGTDTPRTIGRARSSGCIRMANWDVVHVPNYVRPGSVVIVK